MAHRERLIAGAKQCLYERGYARTTARDIVAASDTNLASIGYHFGSKDALLAEALIEATGEWGEAMEHEMAAHDDAGFAAKLDRLMKLFTSHRGLWTSTFEALAAAQPDVVEPLRAAQEEARTGLAETFGLPPETGGAIQALLLGSMAQQIIDPDGAPTGSELEAALAKIVG